MSDGKVDIYVDLSRFKNNIKKAQKVLDLLVLTDTEPYVRYDTGKTNDSAYELSTIGSGKVIYDAIDDEGNHYAYSAYTNEENNVTTTWHPQATPYWFEKSKQLYKDKWINEVKKVVVGNG